MAGLTDAYERAVLDHILTDPTWSPPATLYLALFTVDPTDAGTLTNEVSTSGTAYARISTAAADWSAASGTAPATKTNTATKTFPTATASWGTVVAFGLMDSDVEGAGNMILWGELTVDKTVDSGDTASFAPGALVLQCGDPTDSY
jgi:hypothetical protein